MTEAAQQVDIDNIIEFGQREHILAAGENSQDHGFHDDWPKGPGYEQRTPDEQVQLRRAITEKLGLIHEEISEALGEIRSGRDPLEMYFSHTTRNTDGSETIRYFEEQAYIDGVPLYKPEGFLVELADANIRIDDLVYLVDGADEYVEADRVKRRFNATRPYKHGRKF